MAVVFTTSKLFACICHQLTRPLLRLAITRVGLSGLGITG